MAEHKTQVIEVSPAGDGHLAVRVRCCGDRLTDSVLTLLEIHRSEEEIDKDIAAHMARVEKLHAARDHAQRHIERLLKKS